MYTVCTTCNYIHPSTFCLPTVFTCFSVCCHHLPVLMQTSPTACPSALHIHHRAIIFHRYMCTILATTLLPGFHLHLPTLPPSLTTLLTLASSPPAGHLWALWSGATYVPSYHHEGEAGRTYTTIPAHSQHSSSSHSSLLHAFANSLLLLSFFVLTICLFFHFFFALVLCFVFSSFMSFFSFSSSRPLPPPTPPRWH